MTTSAPAANTTPRGTTRTIRDLTFHRLTTKSGGVSMWQTTAHDRRYALARTGLNNGIREWEIHRDLSDEGHPDRYRLWLTLPVEDLDHALDDAARVIKANRPGRPEAPVAVINRNPRPAIMVVTAQTTTQRGSLTVHDDVEGGTIALNVSQRHQPGDLDYELRLALTLNPEQLIAVGEAIAALGRQQIAEHTP